MEYPIFKVCCRCFTFNQAKYITDAMNGFTMQQTSFPFVCTIVDDASIDGEQEVICKYVEDNFDFSEGSVAFHKDTDYAHITYAQHKTNKNCYFAVLYLKENHYSQHKPKLGYLSEWRDMCEYEAICEGDDYWTSPKKIQKQVSILDDNPQIGVVYTDLIGYNQKFQKFVDMHIKYLNGYQYENMLMKRLNIWTLTICYRLDLRKYIPSISPQKYFCGDILLFLTLTSKREVYCLPEKTAVYRILEESASHFKNKKDSLSFHILVTNTHRYFVKNGPQISKETKMEIEKLIAINDFRASLANSDKKNLPSASFPLSACSNIIDLRNYFLIKLCNIDFIFRLLSSIYKKKL